MKLYGVLYMSSLLLIGGTLQAGIEISNTNTEEAESIEVALQKQQTIKTLENDIALLDMEISKCQKSKKGWTAATVVGGAGVVATGIAAIVQGKKISDKKDELKTTNTVLTTKQEELRVLKGANND